MTQTPDIDPIETREWLDSLHAILQHEGSERAAFIIDQLTEAPAWLRHSH
jgi:pyruvate dehydrogenase E1 component